MGDHCVLGVRPSIPSPSACVLGGHTSTSSPLVSLDVNALNCLCGQRLIMNLINCGIAQKVLPIYPPKPRKRAKQESHKYLRRSHLSPPWFGVSPFPLRRGQQRKMSPIPPFPGEIWSMNTLSSSHESHSWGLQLQLEVGAQDTVELGSTFYSGQN